MKINMHSSAEPDRAYASFTSGIPDRLVMIPPVWSCWWNVLDMSMYDEKTFFDKISPNAVFQILSCSIFARGVGRGAAGRPTSPRAKQQRGAPRGDGTPGELDAGWRGARASGQASTPLFRVAQAICCPPRRARSAAAAPYRRRGAPRAARGGGDRSIVG